MPKYELPSDPAIAGKIADGEIAQSSKKLDMGWIGLFLGSSAEKPGNIAGLLAVAFSGTFICYLIFGPDTPSFSKKEALAIIGSFISLAVGYVFGQGRR